MNKTFFAALMMAFFANPLAAHESTDWSSRDLTILDQWLAAAPADGLPLLPADSLDAARRAADQQAINAAANELALHLAKMHLLGNAGQSERSGWNIADRDEDMPLAEMLEAAVAEDTLHTFFALMRPSDPEYSALMQAYARETDPDRRSTIARNMERWRWLPRTLGEDYVFVNAARFKADLWRDGSRAGTWRVIVGKRSTPTPVFQATIQGVVLNPWWEIPASIVRESVGALVRNNPSLARARGYVVQNGRYRQRPGPGNALGQMKLVMPNPYSVFMHDTAAKQLFAQEERSFSHGCIRTDDAIGFASTLLEGAATRERVDAILASGETRTLAIAKPMPVYITYFTAVSDGLGDVTILDDIYGRDPAIRASWTAQYLQTQPTALLNASWLMRSTAMQQDLAEGDLWPEC